MINITVIGLGLIGGSIALDFKDQLNVHVRGYDKSTQHCILAKQLGLVHDIVDFEYGITCADVVILSVPVDIIKRMLPKILNMTSKDAIVIDVGSTKKNICDIIANHSNRKQYIAAHPLAGTEYSGPLSAHKNLFLGKKNIICEHEKTSETALQTALTIFKSIGMKTIYMSPKEHDRHLAYVSHLSHVSSFMLGKTVLDLEKDEKQIFDLAGTGFESTVRLAKSSPNTWTSICKENREYVLEAMESYIDHLINFKNQLRNGQWDDLQTQMIETNRLKDILCVNK